MKAHMAIVCTHRRLGCNQQEEKLSQALHNKIKTEPSMPLEHRTKALPYNSKRCLVFRNRRSKHQANFTNSISVKSCTVTAYMQVEQSSKENSTMSTRAKVYTTTPERLIISFTGLALSIPPGAGRGKNRANRPHTSKYLCPLKQREHAVTAYTYTRMQSHREKTR